MADFRAVRKAGRRTAEGSVGAAGRPAPKVRRAMLVVAAIQICKGISPRAQSKRTAFPSR